jgi:hypothetical protein
MARAVARNHIGRNPEARIYAPSIISELAGNLVTLSPHQNREITTSTALGDWVTFGSLSLSQASEVGRLNDYFVTNVVRSIEGLADPYGNVTGADPFEYRSVPSRERRIIKAKLKWTGQIPPSPINDD